MKFKMTTAGLNLTLDPMEKMFQNASSLKPLGQLKPLDTTMRYKFCQLHCSRLVGLFRNWRNPFHQINQRLSRACIVHLVIKRTNWSYVKTMSCSGSHLGIPINIKKHIVCKGPDLVCRFEIQNGCHHRS
jgi:hypothetical protein